MTAAGHPSKRIRARWPLALFVLSAALTSPALAEDRMAQLFPGSQEQMCFQRQYDAAHLKKNPGQRVTRILASVVKAKPPAEGVWLRARLQLRGESRPVDVNAGCEWSETANRDTGGNPVFPNYREKEGFICIAAFTSSSAEEAGGVLFNIPANGKTTLLHFDDQIGIWADTNPDKKRKHLRLGKDDRVFRLDRVADSNCASLIDQVRVD